MAFFNRLAVLCVLGLSVFTGSAFAMGGDAGCGLGNMIMPHNSKLSQSLAVTTNGTFSNQLLGITSGTSGCSANAFVQNDDQKAVMYAEANFPSLQVEMSRGQGENLNAFARLLGCSDSAMPAFGELTRTKFGAIYPDESVTPVQMLESVRREMSEDRGLTSGCATRL